MNTALNRVLSLIGMTQSNQELAEQAARFWRNTEDPHWAANAHIREAHDESTWRAIGDRHETYFQDCLERADFGPVKHILEWGVGGGANAVRLVRYCEELIGVDIAIPQLEACVTEIDKIDEARGRFTPMVIDAQKPNEILHFGVPKIDVVVSFYVFELLASPEYGEEVLRIFTHLLRAGGLAMVQIKYTSSLLTRSLRREYAANAANMTTYSIEEFGKLARWVGFEVLDVQVFERDVVEARGNYAYFLLRRP